MGDAAKGWSANNSAPVTRRYRPPGLKHIGFNEMMTSSKILKTFKVGGKTVTWFIAKCKEEGAPLNEYRTPDGRRHFRFGDIVAKALARNLEITPVINKDAPAPRQKMREEAHQLSCIDASNVLTGATLCNPQEIVAKAMGSAELFSASGVYFLVKKNKVIYVGQSTNVFSRVSSHTSVKDFDGWCFVPCEPGKALDLLESLYIHFLRPPENGRRRESDIPSAPLSLDRILSLANAAERMRGAE